MNIMKDKKISIIVPCYNEEESLMIFYNDFIAMYKMIAHKYDYELILVDDGSKDNTLKIMQDISAKDEKAFYLSFSRNFGKESAMYAGFCNASGNYVAVMDADMQDPPSLLPEMLKLMETDKYDSVATRRVTRAGEPPIRSMFARLFYRIINKISDVNIVDGARDFRLMTKPMVSAIVSMGEYNRFSKGIFGWIGFNTYWLSYENIERAAGASKWNFWKLTKYAVDGLINFSDAPLNMASWLGMLFSLLGFLAVIFIVVRRLVFGDPVAGWASIISVVVFMGGIQLFCLGIIGKYLAKNYMETKHRPHFIISKSNKKDIKKIM